MSLTAEVHGLQKTKGQDESGFMQPVLIRKKKVLNGRSTMRDELIQCNFSEVDDFDSSVFISFSSLADRCCCDDGFLSRNNNISLNHFIITFSHLLLLITFITLIILTSCVNSSVCPEADLGLPQYDSHQRD